MLYDRVLCGLLLGLVCLGFVISTSGSFSVGRYILNDSYYFVKREIFYYFVTFMLSLVVLRAPVAVWKRYNGIILLISFMLLLIVLIFSNSVHGASRWIIYGDLCMQPSEFSKLSFLCYLASYLDRRSKEVCNTLWGICKPIMIMLCVALLLLGQPDFGSVIILFIVTLSILFFFGAKLKQLIMVVLLNMFFTVLLVLCKPYRVQRLLGFWDPWKDPFGNGYQLIQSLIAFGRGGVFGQGLGNSIQKMEYLPEAHTDFIFSVIGEELGFIGAISVLLMLFLLVIKAINIGINALNINQKFSGILACSIGMWLGLQVFINVGVVLGILPTKGLTLPFISYGGSSFLIITIASVLLIRIDFELRLLRTQIFKK